MYRKRQTILCILVEELIQRLLTVSKMSICKRRRTRSRYKLAIYPLLIHQVAAWSGIVQSIALWLDTGVVRRGAGHRSTVWS